MMAKSEDKKNPKQESNSQPPMQPSQTMPSQSYAYPASGQANGYQADDEIDLYELWLTLWKYKKLIIIFPIVMAMITAVISLLMTPIYRSEATVLPVSSSGPSISGDMAGLAALAGVKVGGGSDASKIMAVLNSRTLKEDLIVKMNLLDKIFPEGLPEERNPMIAATEAFGKDILSIEEDTKGGGLIKIGIEFYDPELATTMANNYVELLREMLNAKSLTMSKMRRIFLEKQIEQAEARFRKAEQALNSFQKRTKILEPLKQTEGTMRMYTELLSQKTMLEVEYQSLQAALSPANPRLKAISSQIASLRQKIKSIEGSGNIGVFPSIGNAPDQLIEYADIYRELEITKTIYQTMLKMYEQAKLEEAQENVYVEIIDQAIVPDLRIKPKRTLMVLVSGVASGFLAVFLAFFIEWIRNIRSQRQNSGGF